MRRIAPIGLVAVVTLAACVGRTTAAGARDDGSIDAAERTRSAFGAARPTDGSYAAVEHTRSLLVLDTAADDSYDQVEQIRGRSIER